MATQNEITNNNILQLLTDEQRKYIYQIEKHRIEESPTIIPKKLWLYIISYFIGCLLIYFGIGGSLFEYFASGHWVYSPESDYFGTLLNSAIELIRPFIAVIFLSWPLLLIYGLGYALWYLGTKLFNHLREFYNPK